MRRFLIALIAIGIIAIVGLALTQKNQDINTGLIIDAPVAMVWQVLGDTKSYPEWNPFIVRLTGDIRPGGKITVSLDIPGHETSEYDATVRGFIADHEIRWEHDLPIPKLFAGKHKLIIDPAEGGRTRLRHEEEFRGLLVGPLTADYLDQKRLGFEKMNQALKKRVESRR